MLELQKHFCIDFCPYSLLPGDIFSTILSSVLHDFPQFIGEYTKLGSIISLNSVGVAFDLLYFAYTY